MTRTSGNKPQQPRNFRLWLSVAISALLIGGILVRRGSYPSPWLVTSLSLWEYASPPVGPYDAGECLVAAVELLGASAGSARQGSTDGLPPRKMEQFGRILDNLANARHSSLQPFIGEQRALHYLVATGREPVAELGPRVITLGELNSFLAAVEGYIARRDEELTVAGRVALARTLLLVGYQFARNGENAYLRIARQYLWRKSEELGGWQLERLPDPRVACHSSWYPWAPGGLRFIPYLLWNLLGLSRAAEVPFFLSDLAAAVSLMVLAATVGHLAGMLVAYVAGRPGIRAGHIRSRHLAVLLWGALMLNLSPTSYEMGDLISTLRSVQDALDAAILVQMGCIAFAACMNRIGRLGKRGTVVLVVTLTLAPWAAAKIAAYALR